MSHEDEPTTPPAKQPLRRTLRARRRALLPQRDRAADGDAIASAARLLLDALVPTPTRTPGDPAYDQPPCVAIYRSLPHEPPTQALAAMLHARGLRVIVPETLADLDLEWRQLYAEGTEGPRLGSEAIGAAALILAPALAVDHHGTRLGQGGGSYDRALARRSPDALIVAIVNDEEYAGSTLPRDAHDVPVHAVITPGGGFTTIRQPPEPPEPSKQQSAT
jgi:5-formyltetrahydrofolate cyclo-ligase